MPSNHEKGGSGFFDKRRVLWLLSSVLSLLFTALMIICIRWYEDHQSIPKDHLIGNRPSNVSRLKEKGLPFSFLVIGDTQSREKAETLIKLALKEKNDSFMVIVGDFVKEPDLENHRFFLSEMTNEINPPFPVFLVAGNHDIDYFSKIRAEGRRVTPEVYEDLYGARNFDFVFNGCLFILCDIDWRDRTSYLNYLQKTLSQKREGRKHVFVFLHYSPSMVPGDKGVTLPKEDDFFSLMEKYRVTTCFFGHYHGYWRGERNGVNVIVSGGGGGRLKDWQSEWGKFHHILKVTVDQSIITEQMIAVQERFSLEDSLEEGIFIHLFPLVRNRTWTLYVIAIVFLSWGIYSIFSCIHSLKR